MEKKESDIFVVLYIFHFLLLFDLISRSCSDQCFIFSNNDTIASQTLLTLRKMSLFHLIYYCGNFVESQSFRIVSGNSPKTMQKLYLSTPENSVKWRYFAQCKLIVRAIIVTLLLTFRHVSFEGTISPVNF